MQEYIGYPEIKELMNTQEHTLRTIHKELYGMCLGVCGDIDPQEKRRILTFINQDERTKGTLCALLELGRPARSPSAFKHLLISLTKEYPQGRQSNLLPLESTTYTYTKNAQLFSTAQEFYLWFNDTFRGYIQFDLGPRAVATIYFVPDEFMEYIEKLGEDIVVGYYLVFVQGQLCVGYQARRALESDSYAQSWYRLPFHRLDTYHITKILLDKHTSFMDLPQKI